MSSEHPFEEAVATNRDEVTTFPGNVAIIVNPKGESILVL